MQILKSALTRAKPQQNQNPKFAFSRAPDLKPDFETSKKLSSENQRRKASLSDLVKQNHKLFPSQNNIPLQSSIHKDNLQTLEEVNKHNKNGNPEVTTLNHKTNLHSQQASAQCNQQERILSLQVRVASNKAVANLPLLSKNKPQSSTDHPPKAEDFQKPVSHGVSLPKPDSISRGCEPENQPNTLPEHTLNHKKAKQLQAELAGHSKPAVAQLSDPKDLKTSQISSLVSQIAVRGEKLDRDLLNFAILFKLLQKKKKLTDHYEFLADPTVNRSRKDLDWLDKAIEHVDQMLQSVWLSLKLCKPEWNGRSILLDNESQK